MIFKTLKHLQLYKGSTILTSSWVGAMVPISGCEIFLGTPPINFFFWRVPLMGHVKNNEASKNRPLKVLVNRGNLRIMKTLFFDHFVTHLLHYFYLDPNSFSWRWAPDCFYSISSRHPPPPAPIMNGRPRNCQHKDVFYPPPPPQQSQIINVWSICPGHPRTQDFRVLVGREKSVKWKTCGFEMDLNSIISLLRAWAVKGFTNSDFDCWTGREAQSFWLLFLESFVNE